MDSREIEMSSTMPTSTMNDDDENADLSAALQRLSTNESTRFAILPTLGDDAAGGAPTTGAKSIVDLEVNFGPGDRVALLQRLLPRGNEDHEGFLLKIKERIERVGIELPTVEVRFEHLSVESEVRVGSGGLTTLLTCITNTLKEAVNALRIFPRRKHTMPVLHDISGIIKPGRMTLLLGPPGSGKTSLLRALAGRLDKDLKVSGKVTYNGHDLGEFVPERTAAYISQEDVHIGEMTVRETLAFSAQCQGVGSRYDLLTELLRREKVANIKPDADIDAFMKASALEGQEANVVTDYILKILGLETCADALVGDEMRRGISGGQRKRLTTGEMIVSPARVYFMDEISTGLDSSSTFQIVNSLKHWVHILGGTAVISLLQAAPETYNLFDDILVLSDGQVMYLGPRENVLGFFESMGFSCPSRKAIADFLLEVISKKDQKQYWSRRDEPYMFVPVKEFVTALKLSKMGEDLASVIDVPFDKSKSHPAALITTRYGVSGRKLFKAIMDREILFMKRNCTVYISRIFQLVLMSVIALTLFFHTNMKRDSVTNGGIYMGALFFSLRMIIFNGFSELTLTLSKLPVFFKQRDLFFYPAWAYTVPSWILNIPISFVEVSAYVLLTYWAVGFDPDIARFFKQYILLITINQMSSSLFRFIAGAARNVIISNILASSFLLVFVVLGGFILARDKMKKWWIWGYWISPVMYAQNAISVNEMLGHTWHKILNSSASNETLGVQVLKSHGLFTEPKWYWIGLGAMLCFIVIFNCLFTITLAYLRPYGNLGSSISDEELKKKHANVKGEVPQANISEDGGSHRPTGTDIEVDSSNEPQDDSMFTRKGMVLPFVPLSLTFDQITYSVDMPQERKIQGIVEDRLELLKGVSGSFRPGVLTALMGVSGAGKTTLMDVLAGRKTGGYITGNIKISGYPKKQETFARISGYCEQNDIHSPHVTVGESLLFSAWLRLSSDIDSDKRKMFIEDVMELVELTPLRSALVGLPGVNGLSTEQRKRLTIAVELVANPSILFMDEPTSGLDARAAAIVMRAVRNTVDTGRTVVCTIHQPSIDIFEAFDELFLMKQGGEEIYVGPLGHHSSELIKYFEEIQGVGKIRDGYNPATWMMELSAASQEQLLGVDFSEIYKKSELFQSNRALMEQLNQPMPGSNDLYFPTRYSQSLFTQCMACLWKQNLSYWRNPPYNAVRLLFTIIVALLLGTIFWDLGGKIEQVQDLFNAMGSMYAAVLFIGVMNCTSVQPVVTMERTVFYRERAAGMYSGFPFAFGQVVIELPYALVQSTSYALMVYWMIGYDWTVTKLCWHIYFTYFTLLYFTFYGMMAIALTPNYHIATIVSSAFDALWNLFSGFIIPRPKVPFWWRWYCWICPTAWTLYGLVVSQFGDVTTQMDDGTPVMVFVEDYFDFKHSWLGCVAALVATFAVLFAALFTFAVVKFNFQKR